MLVSRWKRKRVAWFLVACLAAAAAVYAIRTTQADDPAKEPYAPVVAGRLVRPISVLTATGSLTIVCEADAFVDLEGEVVKAEREMGLGTDIQAGDRVIDAPFKAEPPRPGVDATPRVGDLGVVTTNVPVYRAPDGQLHYGCAPESRRYDDNAAQASP